MSSHLQKTGSILLAFLLLFSTLSFRVDMHFCRDHLVDLSFTRKAATCGMVSSNKSPAGCVMAAMNCCRDVEVIIQGQDDLQLSADTIALEITSHTAVPSPLFHVNLPRLIGAPRNQFFREYSPPPLIRQVHLLNQTFLI